MSFFKDFSFAGKKALVRVDFNVPLNEHFQITDDTRMRATVKTINKILQDGGAVILMSHLGRPKDGPTENQKEKGRGQAGHQTDDRGMQGKGARPLRIGCPQRAADRR